LADFGWITEGRLERERHSESERKTLKERKCEELKEWNRQEIGTNFMLF